MKVRIDEELCTGHGRCYALAPEMFDSDDFGHGVVLHPEGAPGAAGAIDSLIAKAELAAKNCPERAITVEK